MGKRVKHEMDLIKLVEQFHSEDKARDYLEHLRWPLGRECPKCETDEPTPIESRNQYACRKCEYHFSVTTGTVLHNTKLPTWKWLLATYMMTVAKKGVSANQLKRTLSVSYKTAWYLCHRIRAAMTEHDAEPLQGQVEVDETWIGGKTTEDNPFGNKTIVAGIIQRGGDIRLEVIEKASRKLLHDFINRHIRPDTEAIFTDEWSGYKGISDHDTRHETVNHSRKVWVRGDAHTNSIENVWSLLKRSVIGSFHHVSGKHLNAYCDELEWRFNNRKNPYLFRDTVKRLVRAESLPYRKLVGKKEREPHRWAVPYPEMKERKRA